MRRIAWFAMVALLVFANAVHAQQSGAKKTDPPPRPKESLWERVLRFSGVSATPSTLKGSDDELLSGQVWVADLASGARRRITEGDGYRSPVYFPNGSDILTLRDGYLIRIPSTGEPVKLFSAQGITKLIGFGIDDPDGVLALKEDDAGRVSAARISMSMGSTVLLPYDRESSRDHQMIEHLQGWQRTYGETVVYVKQESIEALSGTVNVLNVFLKAPAGDPRNVSACDAANCGQPSLSPDGKRVLFIKAGL